MENILPCHSQLREDEEFSCWIMRLAAAHGLSVEEFLVRIDGPGIEHVDGWSRSGTAQARICSTICSAKTGIPLERLRAAMLCELAGIFGDRTNIDLRYYNVNDPWITQYVRKNQTHYVGEFCPLCLIESSHFRLSWRISLFVSCPQHGCLLAHLCGNCEQHFEGFRHLRNLDLSQNFDVTTRCSQCLGPLTHGNPITPVPPGVRRLEDLHRLMIRNSRFISYFSALHSMLRLMARGDMGDSKMARAVRAKLADMPWEWEDQLPRFERCEPIQRQYLLQAAFNLFRSWPAVFIDVIKSCRVLPTAVFEPPMWMANAMNLAYGCRTLNIEGVRAEFWNAAESEGWYQAAELLNGAPRSASGPQKFSVQAAREPISQSRRATSNSD